MTKAPVYYALAQVVFNPVARMEKYVGEIQDILRRQGYTLFETHQVTQLQLGGAGKQEHSPEVRSVTNWLIAKADRTAGFILTPSSLVYHTTHYDTHQDFMPEVLRGLRAVHEVVELDHIARLGLRYLDAILPGEGEDVSAYLADGLQGVSFANAKQRYALSESVFDTAVEPLVKVATLVSRVYRMYSPLGFPPDLFPHGLRPMERFQSAEALLHAVIDIDHFAEDRMPVDFAALEEQLLSLHGGVKQAFEVIVTEHAKAVWR